MSVLVTHFNRQLRQLALLLLTAVWVPGAVVAQESVSLTVKPLLCIIDEKNESCDMDFKVDWQSAVTASYCLGDDVGTAPLACWLEQSSGRHLESRVVDEPFSFILSHADDNESVAEVRVDVMSTKTTDRRRKRSRRHVWSVL